VGYLHKSSIWNVVKTFSFSLLIWIVSVCMVYAVVNNFFNSALGWGETSSLSWLIGGVLNGLFFVYSVYFQTVRYSRIELVDGILTVTTWFGSVKTVKIDDCHKSEVLVTRFLFVKYKMLQLHYKDTILKRTDSIVILPLSFMNTVDEFLSDIYKIKPELVKM